MTDPETQKTLEELARQTGKYPADAFAFVREGLKFTVQKTHQNRTEEKHISGKDLCWGLRDFALKRWGLLAPVVLRQWNITTTMDFGQIVFAMVEAGWMAKREQDNIRDFANVYDFRCAFDAGLELEPGKKGTSDTEEAS